MMLVRLTREKENMTLKECFKEYLLDMEDDIVVQIEIKPQICQVNSRNKRIVIELIENKTKF